MIFFPSGEENRGKSRESSISQGSRRVIENCVIARCGCAEVRWNHFVRALASCLLRRFGTRKLPSFNNAGKLDSHDLLGGIE